MRAGAARSGALQAAVLVRLLVISLKGATQTRGRVVLE